MTNTEIAELTKEKMEELAKDIELTNIKINKTLNNIDKKVDKYFNTMNNGLDKFDKGIDRYCNVIINGLNKIENKLNINIQESKN